MNGSPWETIGFFTFALLAIAPAIMILLTENIIRAAFFLLASLFGFAGLYLVIGADFLAFTQVLVYIGGILVLILFGVMLTHKDPVSMRETKHWGQIVPGILVFFLVLLGTFTIAWRTGWVGEEASPAPATALIGDQLMTKYILPFEIVSVLLLAALVGGVYIARGKQEER